MSRGFRGRRTRGRDRCFCVCPPRLKKNKNQKDILLITEKQDVSLQLKRLPKLH